MPGDPSAPAAEPRPHLVRSPGWPLETARLVLRRPQPDDLVLLVAAVLTDAEVMRHVNAGGALSPVDGARFCTSVLDVEGSGRKPAVVVEKASGRVIGYAGPLACRVLDKDDFEIGFVLARSAWGAGYGTELGHAQLDYAFRTLGCSRVLALAAPDNAASIATLTRIGMHFIRCMDVAGRGLRNVYAAWRR